MRVHSDHVLSVQRTTTGLTAADPVASSVDTSRPYENKGTAMTISSLRGLSILVVEHEPAIARELESELTQAGAKVFAAGGLRDALYLAEYPALSAAVMNLRLGSDTTAAVCRRLDDLGIPFMFYTRFDTADAEHSWPRAPVVAKPATSAKVAATVAGLLS